MKKKGFTANRIEEDKKEWYTRKVPTIGHPIKLPKYIIQLICRKTVSIVKNILIKSN